MCIHANQSLNLRLLSDDAGSYLHVQWLCQQHNTTALKVSCISRPSVRFVDMLTYRVTNTWEAAILEKQEAEGVRATRYATLL